MAAWEKICNVTYTRLCNKNGASIFRSYVLLDQFCLFPGNVSKEKSMIKTCIIVDAYCDNFCKMFTEKGNLIRS